MPVDNDKLRSRAAVLINKYGEEACDTLSQVHSISAALKSLGIMPAVSIGGAFVVACSIIAELIDREDGELGDPVDTAEDIAKLACEVIQDLHATEGFIGEA